MSCCCPSRPCVVFLACIHLALFLPLTLSPDNSLLSSWCDHSMLTSLLWRCLTVSLYSSYVKNSLICFLCCPWNPQNWEQKAALLLPPTEYDWKHWLHIGYFLYFTMGQEMPGKIALLKGDPDPTWFSGPTWVQIPNGNLMGPANFVGLTGVINKQTMEHQ